MTERKTNMKYARSVVENPDGLDKGDVLEVLDDTLHDLNIADRETAERDAEIKRLRDLNERLIDQVDENDASYARIKEQLAALRGFAREVITSTNHNVEFLTDTAVKYGLLELADTWGHVHKKTPLLTGEEPNE